MGTVILQAVVGSKPNNPAISAVATVGSLQLPLWAWYIIGMFVIFFVFTATIIFFYLVIQNGITIKDKVVIKGVRSEKRDEKNDNVKYNYLMGRTHEIRKGFMNSMYNHLKDVNLYHGDTCRDHLKSIDKLIVEYMFDFINDNHVEKKANYNLSETKQLLLNVVYSIERRWKADHRKLECDLTFEFEKYKPIVKSEILRFYENFQREVVKMLTRQIELYSSKDFDFSTAVYNDVKKKDVERLMDARRKIVESYIRASQTVLIEKDEPFINSEDYS